MRFEDQSTERTLIKLMTDGILLAETQHDRFLEKYDTIIVDEAHERSLNIDFLLGFLKMLLPRRPDLKVIITSATIDLERFSKHFNDAPIIEVSGRTYPVETWYRPLAAEIDEDATGSRTTSPSTRASSPRWTRSPPTSAALASVPAMCWCSSLASVKSATRRGAAQGQSEVHRGAAVVCAADAGRAAENLPAAPGARSCWHQRRRDSLTVPASAT